jgi:hypothetical protein
MWYYLGLVLIFSDNVQRFKCNDVGLGLFSFGMDGLLVKLGIKTEQTNRDDICLM